VGAHQDIPALTCSPDGGPEVFFRFGLAVPSSVYLDVYDPVGNDVNVALEIYSGDGGGCPAQAIGCDAESGGLACGGRRWPRIFKPNLSAGNYVVAARGTSGVSGVYGLRFQRVPVACAGAPLLDFEVHEGSTCTGHDMFSPACAPSGQDTSYYVAKCPAPGLSVDTCSPATAADTLLQVSVGSMDLVDGKCVGASDSRILACNDNAQCPFGGASSIANAGRNQRGIFTIAVDTHGSSACGPYELHYSQVP
jgi:hypothetical protein